MHSFALCCVDQPRGCRRSILNHCRAPHPFRLPLTNDVKRQQKTLESWAHETVDRLERVSPFNVFWLLELGASSAIMSGAWHEAFLAVCVMAGPDSDGFKIAVMRETSACHNDV